jgi:hypothetical protein
MEELFDQLAKDAARGVSRRQLVGRFGWGVAAAVFAALGVMRARAADGSCVPQCCETLCRSFDTGQARGQCIAECMRGEGITAAACRAQCGEPA